jgi:hypothetical protein
MDPATLALAAIVWQGSTEIAAGRAERGPWQQNESRYDYVDDPAVAMDERGGVAFAWVDQGKKDVYFGKQGEAVNVSRSPDTFSWLPRIALAGDNVFVLWQEIIFSGGSHGGDMLFARSGDGGKTFSAPLNLSSSRAGDGKGRINPQLWHNGSFDLVVDGEVVYAAWTEYEGRLWLRRSTDGRTFSNKVFIRTEKPARAPSLAVQGNSVYLAWTVGDERSADVRVARSDDGGATFGKAILRRAENRAGRARRAAPRVCGRPANRLFALQRPRREFRATARRFPGKRGLPGARARRGRKPVRPLGALRRASATDARPGAGGVQGRRPHFRGRRGSRQRGRRLERQLAGPAHAQARGRQAGRGRDREQQPEAE